MRWPTRRQTPPYDSQGMQRFAHIELDTEGVPEATTMLKFRRLLETHDLCQALFAETNTDLALRRLLLRADTLVDGTLIAAPLSTKNEKRAPTRRCIKPRMITSGAPKPSLVSNSELRVFFYQLPTGITKT